MANITDFKVLNDTRTITKVRVSMDDGKTWGVLYEGNPIIDRYIEWDEEVEFVIGGCPDCYDGNCDHSETGWTDYINYRIIYVYKDGSTKQVKSGSVETDYYYHSGIYNETHKITHDGVEYSISSKIKVIKSDRIVVEVIDTDTGEKLSGDMQDYYDHIDYYCDTRIDTKDAWSKDVKVHLYVADGETILAEETYTETLTVGAWAGDSEFFTYNFLGKEVNVEIQVDAYYYTHNLYLPDNFEYVTVDFYDGDEVKGSVEIDVYEKCYLNEAGYEDNLIRGGWDTETAYTEDTYYIDDWYNGATTTGTICIDTDNISWSKDNIPIRFISPYEYEGGDESEGEEDPPVYTVECENCGYEYNEDLSECPNCHGESDDEEEDEVIEVICSNPLCGDAWDYIPGKYTSCPGCGTPYDG